MPLHRFSHRALLLILAVVAVGLGAVGTTSAAGEAAAPPYKGPESGIPSGYGPVKVIKNANVSVGFMVVADNESNIAAVKSMRQEAKRLGIKLTVLYDHVKADQQVTNFGQLVNQKVDGIIFYPLDPRAVRPSLANAAKAKILLFAQDAVLPGQKPDPRITSTIMTGRDHQAYLQVKHMAKLKPKAKIAVIGLGFPVAALEYYVKRVYYWAGKFGLTVLGRANNPSDNESGGEQAMNGLLGKFPEIDGVLAYNDPSALGASAAARANNRKIAAIGLNGGSDGRAGVERGRLAATVQTGYPGMVCNANEGNLSNEDRSDKEAPTRVASLERTRYSTEP